MDAVDIGKGKMRVRCRNKRTRERLRRIHEIIIDGDRVIFPKSLFAAVLGTLGTAQREKRKIETQIRMELGDGTK